MLKKFGYELRRLRPPPSAPNIPDGELYQPFFSPWLATSGVFSDYYVGIHRRSLVSRDRCFVLYKLLAQSLCLPGDVWECGVYQGGTAAMLARIINDSGSDKRLFLFDTFAGMPSTDPDKDWHKAGDFADTSLKAVKEFVGHADRTEFRQGFIPDTFVGLEERRVAFAHIDLDIYRSIADSLEFIWPRLSPGGVVVFDDYGAPTCPGARSAVDDFFARRKSIPLCLPTGQAIVFKLPAGSP